MMKEELLFQNTLKNKNRQFMLYMMWIQVKKRQKEKKILKKRKNKK